ncbi:MAG: AMP-binding protein, partial [Gammaproteobacteria bacterium]|nr:AMP-binding protein [Gammaproteobacteria bacterium]
MQKQLSILSTVGSTSVHSQMRPYGGQSIIPASAILSARQAPQTVIAMKNGRRIDYRQLFAEVSVITEVLAQRPEKRWALYCSDSYEFLLAFLGLLHAGKTVILLPNLQTGFVQAIAVHFDAIVCDHAAAEIEKPQILLKEIKWRTDAGCQFSPLDSKLARIELFTSGSTGMPKRIEKTLAQFEQEIETLEATWGLQMGRAAVLATVSHQHIYGLLFRVLWPLMAGRCFDSGLYQYPEQLFARILQHPRSVLISSPAHLSRIPDQIDFGGSHLAAVFSSGGPLDNAAALKLSKTLGFGVIEVFGSSETGGVACRCQTEAAPSPPWTPLAKVDISVEPQQRCLMVRSPYIGKNDWHLMSDIVEMNADGKFYLRGRADKIVKIEEKRLSLTEMEAQLLTSELVKQAVITVLDGVRKLVAVVAVLSDSGQKLLADKGKKAINDSLRRHLSRYFETVVLPRKWRYNDSLPINSQGKVTAASLQQLFSQKPAMVTRPEDKILERNNKQIKLELNIPEDLYYFKGHFDTQPILPGVVQIDWAIAYSRKYLSVSGDFMRMEAIKFSKLIEPGCIMQLMLQFNSE